MRTLPIWMALMAISGCAAAQMTAAGTKLATSAEARFFAPDGRDMGSAYSNPASVQVGQTVEFGATSVKNGDSCSPQFAAYFPIEISNGGNGFDRFLFSLTTPAPGWSVRVVPDLNGDGQFQYSENTAVTVTDWLDQAGSTRVLLEVKAPADSVMTDGTDVTIAIASESNSLVVWRQTVSVGVKGVLNPKWWYELREQINGSVTVDGNLVFVATDQGSLRVHEISGSSTPAEIWDARIAGAKFVGKPLVNDDILLAPMTDRRMAQFDLNGQRLQCYLTTGTGFSTVANPILSEARTVAPTVGAKLVSIQSSGNINLVSDRIANTEISSTPTHAGRTLFVGCQDGSLAALDSVSMRMKWRVMVESGSPIISPPAIDTRNGLIFVATKRALYCLGLYSRNLRWKAQIDSDIVSAVNADTDTRNIYFVTRDRRVWGFSGLTSLPVRGFPMTLPGDGDVTSVAAALKRNASASTPYLWLGTPDGRVFAVNASNGFTYYDWTNGPLWNVEFYGLCSFHMITNTAVIGCKDGRVFGFEMR